MNENIPCCEEKEITKNNKCERNKKNMLKTTSKQRVNLKFIIL